LQGCVEGRCSHRRGRRGSASGPNSPLESHSQTLEVTVTVDEEYAALVADVMTNGEDVVTRNSRVKRRTAKTVAFTTTPLVGVRKTAWKTCIRELEWMLSGSNRIEDAHPSVRPWWKPWVKQHGEIPFNYGVQFRHYGRPFTVYGPLQDGFDQIKYLVDGVRDHPYSRRNLITTWHTADMASPQCPLTNCWGSLIQAFVGDDGLLSLVTYQRSADVVCGLGHNWLQMAAFHLWLAARTGRRVGELTWIGGDVHVYSDHFDLAKEIVARVGECRPTPTLTYTPSSEEFVADDFALDGEYRSVITTAAKMVV
jgi:thymidylate synthase